MRAFVLAGAKRVSTSMRHSTLFPVAANMVSSSTQHSPVHPNSPFLPSSVASGNDKNKNNKNYNNNNINNIKSNNYGRGTLESLAARTTTESSQNGASNANDSNFASSSSSTNTTGLSQTELEDLRRSFTLFDIEGEGRIKVETLRSALQVVLKNSDVSVDNDNPQQEKQQERRPHPIFQRLEHWIQEANQKKQSNDEKEAHDDYLNFVDFVSMMTDPDPSDNQSELQKAFDLFDGDGKGFITIHDLSNVAQELGEVMSQEEMEEMVSRAGAEDGQVTYDLFERIMTKRMFDN